MRFAVFAVAALAASDAAAAAPTKGILAARGDMTTRKLAQASASSEILATTLASGAMSILQSTKPGSDITQQVEQTKKPKAPRLPGIGLLQEECSSHSECTAGEEYCDIYNDCYDCDSCSYIQDSIDGYCPECASDTEDAVTTCLAENGGPCLAGLLGGEGFAAVFAGNSTAAIAESLNGFCANCTDATGEFEEAFTACNLTADSSYVTQISGIVALLDNACDDRECAAATIWAFQDLTARQDTFCDNQECGSDILTPLLEVVTAISEVDFGTECITGFFDLYCLADEDSGEYCVGALTSFNGTVAPFCDSTCPSALTTKFAEISQLECGIEGLDELDFTFETCDDSIEYGILDLCTENANGDYCLDLMTTVQGPNCDFDSIGEEPEVPAPGPEGDDTASCSDECAMQLETYLETMGCCAKWSLDIACVDDAIVEFVTDDCGVSVGDACERPEVEATTASAASARVLSAVLGFAAAAASAAVLMW